MMIAFLLLLASCNSGGTNVTEQQAAQFVPGKTTTAQVVTQLGQPDTTNTLVDGTMIYSYNHFEGSSNPINFVPVVGLLAGSSNSKHNVVNFHFNAQGIYQGKDSLVSSGTMSTGLLNQH